MSVVIVMLVAVLIFATYIFFYQMKKQKKQHSSEEKIIYCLMINIFLFNSIAFSTVYDKKEEDGVTLCPNLFIFNQKFLGFCNLVADLSFLTLGAYFISLMRQSIRRFDKIIDISINPRENRGHFDTSKPWIRFIKQFLMPALYLVVIGIMIGLQMWQVPDTDIDTEAEFFFQGLISLLFAFVYLFYCASLVLKIRKLEKINVAGGTLDFSEEMRQQVILFWLMFFGLISLPASYLFYVF